MAILQSISSFISREYRSESYIVQRKALALFYSVITISSILLAMMVMFLVLQPVSFLRSVAALGVTITVGVISLFILKSGRYHVAANFMVTSVALLLLAAQFAKLGNDPHTGYATSFYIMMVVVVMAALFCSGKWLFAITALFIAGDLIFYYLVGGRLDPLGRQAANVGVLFSVFAFALIMVVSYLIVSITAGAAKRSDREAQRNRESFETIQSLLVSVKDSSGVLARSSDEMKNLTITFSDNFQHQASAAEEITASMEEVSSVTDSNAAGASEQYETILAFLQELGRLSDMVAGMGGRIRESLGEVEEINRFARSGESSLSDMQQSMEKIHDGSNRMTGILEIINSISDKINLLSLNAAIEAARAGDAGRGFAVVADEISKLADQTAASLKEIDDLIRQNIGEIARGSEIMGGTVETINRILQGIAVMNDKINDIDEYMSQQDGINRGVNERAVIVRDRAVEIKSSSQEQKIAADEVLKSISEVNGITQRNSEILADMKSLAEEVSGMAGYLAGKVSEIKA
ncbi:MAG: hypothetical protein JXA20_08560 [Spirochaetes bacterium]|nr:hypothetical protein [Spirochaetota bacterium]